MATIPAEARRWDVGMPGVDVESVPLPPPHAWRPTDVPAIRPRTGAPRQVLVPPDAATRAETAHAAVTAAHAARVHVPERSTAKALVARARALWPGLLPRQLANTRGEPRRIVRLAARRSNEAPEVLMRMLLGDRVDSDRR
jgi:hypothetical protein